MQTKYKNIVIITEPDVLATEASELPFASELTTASESTEAHLTTTGEPWSYGTHDKYPYLWFS